MLMLDLFCGLGGASEAQRARGWTVVGVDCETRLQPDVVADLATWRYSGPRPDLIWASPPCTEFAQGALPWNYSGKPRPAQPSLDLLRAAIRIIEEAQPRFWLIENVQGARKHFAPLLGPPLDWSGSVWVWGVMPALFRLPPPGAGGHKWKVSPRPKTNGCLKLEALHPDERRKWVRARIPYAVSLAVAEAVERAS